MTIQFNDSGVTFPDGSVQASAGAPQIITVAASVATNVLTVTLNPCSLAFRNASATVGTSQTFNVATALTLNIPTNQSYGVSTTGVVNRYAVLALNNAGTVVLGLSILSGGVQLDETNYLSTVSTALNTGTAIFSTVTASNLAYRVVGFVDIAYTSGSGYSVAPVLVQGVGGQAFASMSSLGYGQTWQAVTRTSGTTYYNTTGKPIILSVNASVVGNYQIAVNGVVAVSGLPTASSNAAITAVIPTSSSYVVTSSGHYSLELR
jgi:hypothetical protein